MPTYIDDEHVKLVQYMIRCGYKGNAEGVCYGFTHMAVQALLSNDLKTFDDRLELILEDYDKNRLNERQRNETGITAFLDGVELYHLQKPYAYLLSKEPKRKQDATLVMPLLQSESIESQGGFNIIDQSSALFFKDELTNYFSSLADHIQQSNFNEPIAISLNNNCHIVTVGYDYDEKKWIFIDSNNLPIVRLNPSELAEAVHSSLGEQTLSKKFDEAIALTPSIFSTQLNRENLTSLLANWKKDKQYRLIYEFSNDLESKYNDKNRTEILDLATHMGDLALIKTIQNHFNSKLSNGLLETAIIHSQPECIQYFVDNGVDAHERNKDNKTPLMIAAAEGNIEICELLIGLGAKFEDGDAQVVLFEAAETGNLTARIFDFLKQHGSNINGAKSNSGKTALMIAAENGHEEVCRLLIEKGADVNISDQLGDSALSIAASNGLSNVCARLIKHGADVNKPVASGESLLQVAAQRGHAQTLELLFKHAAKPDPILINGLLTISVQDNLIEVCKVLVNHGAKFSKDNIDDALSCAVYHDNIALWNYFTTIYPGRLSIKNAQAALEKAALYGKTNFCDFLSQTYNIELTSAQATSGLLYIARKGDIEACLFLINKGANLNATNDRGQTPLMLAVMSNNYELCELLIHSGADLEVKDEYDMTAEMIASDYYYAEIEDLLKTSLSAQKENTSSVNNAALLFKHNPSSGKELPTLVEESTKTKGPRKP